MVRQVLFLVLVGVISTDCQTEESVSIESLLRDSSSTLHHSVLRDPSSNTITIVRQAPTPSSDDSIGSALGVGGNPETIDPSRQPIINQSPPNVGATGQLMQSLGVLPPVSEESAMIVAGLVEAFMHREHLLPGEKTCLETSVSELTGDIVGTGKDVIDAIRSLINGAAVRPGVASQAKSEPTVNVASAGIDAALKLTSFVTLASSLMKNCVQGDALGMLNETAHHLIDMKYLGHRLVISGVDIAHCLADSIISYENHQYYRFGKDIGMTLRKVLLSNSSRGARLPEGVPEEEIVQETTQGLMDGLFVGGSSIEITDVARPDVDIKLDLHRCIAGNEAFFKEIFAALWDAVAQFSANGELHGLGTPSGEVEGASPRWTNELMIALLQLPTVFERCNINVETQRMLMESIQALGQIQVHLHFPEELVTYSEISEQLAKAVKDWTNWKFDRFGNELGVMLRELVLRVYPIKYSVGQDGRLRRQISLGQHSEFLKADGRSTAPGFLLFTLAGVALIGVAIRRLRQGNASIRESLPEAHDCHLNDELME